MKLNKEQKEIVKAKAVEYYHKGINTRQFVEILKAEIWLELSLAQATYYLNEAKKLASEEQSKEDKELLAFLKKKGIGLKELKELFKIKTLETKKQYCEKIGDEGELVLWIVSDTHLGNKLCALDELKEFYEIAKKEWVQVFVHAGDLTDWVPEVYRWHTFELAEPSAMGQVDLVVKEYPKIDNANTYYILGNHDQNALKKVGLDISQYISMLRDDLKFIWWYNGRIILNWIIVELQHWGGTWSYAVSYKLQKYLETYRPDEQPDIYILWHYHQALYMVYRWIHSFLPGAFLKENLLAKRYKLGNTIWWWIVRIKKKNGKKQVFAKFIEFN